MRGNNFAHAAVVRDVHQVRTVALDRLVFTDARGAAPSKLRLDVMQ
jgi:hypothetical protein